ncbi:MAG: ATP-binding protein, partial [Deltaproteobacteria bacterium]|nr:ATP-binding protein [Deltaproteobacteria bacterium]
MFHRKKQIERLKRHLEMKNPPIQVILGPRQVGKTTAIRAFLKDWSGPTFYHTADLATPPDALWIETQWI